MNVGDDCGAENSASECCRCGQGVRGAGESRAEVRKVELGGRELSSIGYEMAMRENVGQEAESQGGENVSSECFVESIVLSRLSTAVGRSCAVQ